MRRGGRAIELTRTEFKLLELFLLNPRQVLAAPQIFERVWGYDFGPTSNSLEVYVGYLRRKLEAGGEPRLIQTVRGVGYALREPMSFRTHRAGRRDAVAIAVAVFVAAYVVARDALDGQVDDSLRERAAVETVLRDTPARVRVRLPTGPLGVSGDEGADRQCAATDPLRRPGSARCLSPGGSRRSPRADGPAASGRLELRARRCAPTSQRLGPGSRCSSPARSRRWTRRSAGCARSWSRSRSRASPAPRRSGCPSRAPRSRRSGG